MFAVFLSEKMDLFYEIVTAFPTVVFSVLLVVCFFYWILAVLGLVDLDIVNLDVPQANPEAGTALGNSLSSTEVLAGLLMRLDLHKVPLPIVISLLALVGWFICYYAVYFIYPYLPTGLVRIPVGLLIFFATVYLALLITAQVIKPLKPLFEAASQEVEKDIVGQVAIVRTLRVDETFGEASLDDGGAGLIVKVRSYGGSQFKHGDRVVLLEYVPQEHVYRVVSEQEFLDK